MITMEKEVPHKDQRPTDGEEKRLLKVYPEWLKDIVVFAIRRLLGHRPYVTRSGTHIITWRVFEGASTCSTPVWIT